MELPVKNEFEINGEIHNFYRVKKINDRYLLTTDHGTWVQLKEKQYHDFLNNCLDQQTHNELVERGLILKQDNIDDIIKSYYYRYSYIEDGIILHLIVPTIRCNFRCVYCHAKAHDIADINKYNMTEKTMKRTLDFIFDSTIGQEVEIGIQGGEPLLNIPLIKKMIFYTEELSKKYEKTYNISLITNLSRMTEELLDFFCKYNIRLGGSLDGPEIVHDKNRKFAHTNAGTYKEVVKTLNLCKDRGIHVGLMQVPTRYSLPYWKEIVDEYVKWDQKFIKIEPLECLGYAREVWDEIGYTMEEFVEFWEKSTDYIFKLIEKGTFILGRYMKHALKKIFYKKSISFLDWVNPCGYMRGLMTYDYNGNIHGCDESRSIDDLILGNVHNDTYRDIVNKNKSRALMESSILESLYCDSCVYKPFCGVCPLAHYNQEKNYMIKLNKTNKCLFHKSVLNYAFKKIIFEPKQIQKIILAGTFLKQKFI